MSIDDSIKRIITKHIDIALEIEEIGNDHYLDQIGVNSINFIRMIIEIEQEYEVEFDIEMLGIESFEKVGNFIAYAEKLVGSR